MDFSQIYNKFRRGDKLTTTELQKLFTFLKKGEEVASISPEFWLMAKQLRCDIISIEGYLTARREL